MTDQLGQSPLPSLEVIPTLPNVGPLNSSTKRFHDYAGAKIRIQIPGRFLGKWRLKICHRHTNEQWWYDPLRRDQVSRGRYLPRETWCDLWVQADRSSYTVNWPGAMNARALTAGDDHCGISSDIGTNCSMAKESWGAGEFSAQLDYMDPFGNHSHTFQTIRHQ